MSNLLWKFVALAGVAGVGFMVVLQTMETMAVKPQLGPQQATASQEQTPVTPQVSPTGPPPVPPLRTKETVTFGDPFAAKSATGPESAESMPQSSDPFGTDSFPQAPANNNVAQLDFPSGLPAPASAPETVSEVPELPLLIPMNGEFEEPGTEGDSEENPFTDPPQLASGPQPAPALPIAQAPPEADPFADPVPPPASKASESEPITVPFDPYEPETGEPEEMPTPAPPSPNDAPVLFPPAKENPAKAESPALVENSASAEEDPGLQFPPFPAPAADAGSPVSEPAQNPDAPPAAGNVPEFPEFFGPPPAGQSPGRASVQIPVKERPAAANLRPEPKTAETTPPRVEPLAFPEAPETPVPEQTPASAVPVAGVAEEAPKGAPSAPESFVDPLDQLTFPDAGPPAAKTPEQTGPGPNPLPEPVRPESPPRPALTGPNPEPAQFPAGPDNQADEPASDPIEGVGELSQTVPAGPQQPELKIEKTAPPKAVLGQPMIYNILVRNVGDSAAHEVIVEDQVPKGTQLTGTIPRGEMTENRLIWRLGVIPPGEEKKIAVRVIPVQEGQIGSVAKVSFVAEVAAKTVVAAPKLDLEFTGPARAVLGDPVTYHFKLANTGTGDAANVFLRNILPEGLNHPDGNDLEYEVGTLKAGEVKEIDLTVNATKAGDFTNKAVVSAGGGLKKESAVKVKIIGDRLVITRTGPKRRYVGRTATYSNRIVNQSDAKVSPVHVVEVIPPGMDFVEASAGGKFDPQKRTVTWAIAELGPSQNQLLKLDLLARQEGPQASKVVAYDPNGTRAVVESETTVEGYTALRLDVRDYEEPVDVGEQVGLRIVATNKGTKAGSQVIVKVTIPEEMEFVSAKGPVDFKHNGATLTFDPVESLPAQQELTFDLVLKSIKPGDSRVRLEIGSNEMDKPLGREEGIRILPNRP